MPTARTTIAAGVTAALGLTAGAAAIATQPSAPEDDRVTAAGTDDIAAAPLPAPAIDFPGSDALAEDLSQRQANAAELAVVEMTPAPEPEPTQESEPAPEPEPEPEPAPEPAPEPEPEAQGGGRQYAGEDGVGVYRGRTYDWDELAQCESSGNWQETEGTYEGGLQFHPQTWDAYKDPGMPDAAYEATRVQQMAIAEYVLDDQSWDAWPACSSKLGWR